LHAGRNFITLGVAVATTSRDDTYVGFRRAASIHFIHRLNSGISLVCSA
jgi:hypothetical protein